MQNTCLAILSCRKFSNLTDLHFNSKTGVVSEESIPWLPMFLQMRICNNLDSYLLKQPSKTGVVSEESIPWLPMFLQMRICNNLDSYLLKQPSKTGVVSEESIP